jgi:CxxC-x17-CxxC domain-containing protein
MGRVELVMEKRKDFYLYVDELQNFVTESFANILSEARKYRLNLTLAHQYINQLIFDGNTTVRDAVFGNVGTMIAFRVGAEDAEFLEKEFEPVFMANDLVNLSKYNIYLKLMIDGIAGDAFSATTLPPMDLSDTEENEIKIIKNSRERYGEDKNVIEEKIERWSGMIVRRDAAISETNTIPPKVSGERPAGNPVAASEPEVIREEITRIRSQVQLPKIEREGIGEQRGGEAPAAAPKRPEEKVQERYETVCSTCDQPITVPFKPDPARPAFCKECLKDYQRAMARARNESERAKRPARERPVREDDNPFRQSAKVLARSEIVANAPKEKPMSLSQMAHIAPKKFKPQRKKAKVDLGEVRKLISESQKNNGNGT